MFGIGIPELLIIGVIALIFIGPNELPKVLRTLGKSLADFKRASNQLKHAAQHELDQIAQDTNLADVKETFNETGAVATKFSHMKNWKESPEDALNTLANSLEHNPSDHSKDSKEAYKQDIGLGESENKKIEGT